MHAHWTSWTITLKHLKALNQPWQTTTLNQALRCIICRAAGHRSWKRSIRPRKTWKPPSRRQWWSCWAAEPRWVTSCFGESQQLLLVFAGGLALPGFTAVRWHEVTSSWMMAHELKHPSIHLGWTTFCTKGQLFFVCHSYAWLSMMEPSWGMGTVLVWWSSWLGHSEYQPLDWLGDAVWCGCSDAQGPTSNSVPWVCNW